MQHSLSLSSEYPASLYSSEYIQCKSGKKTHHSYIMATVFALSLQNVQINVHWVDPILS